MNPPCLSSGADLFFLKRVNTFALHFNNGVHFFTGVAQLVE